MVENEKRKKKHDGDIENHPDLDDADIIDHRLPHPSSDFYHYFQEHILFVVVDTVPLFLTSPHSAHMSTSRVLLVKCHTPTWWSITMHSSIVPSQWSFHSVNLPSSFFVFLLPARHPVCLELTAHSGCVNRLFHHFLCSSSCISVNPPFLTSTSHAKSSLIFLIFPNLYLSLFSFFSF